MTLAVYGAGAFGSALAISLAAKGPVTLWARDPVAAAQMQSQRVNAVRLPAARFPDSLRVTSDANDVAGSDTVLIAVPMQSLREFLTAHRAQLSGRRLVLCCKGAELGTGLGPTGVVDEVLPGTETAFLTGPSFAADIAAGLPTALTLACAEAPVGTELQAELSTATLRLYRTDDVIGAEMGGALKNVIAIGCGAVIGAGLGDSARAALMTRGYAEMVRYATAQGARAETLAGLSGLGDLALTCTSGQSRNYRRGLALGRGDEFDAATTVEGAATARAVLQQAQVKGIDMPVAAAVVALLAGDLSVGEVVAEMFARPLKQE